MNDLPAKYLCFVWILIFCFHFAPSSTLPSNPFEYSFYQDGTPQLDVLYGVYADNQANIFVAGFSYGLFLTSNSTRSIVVYKMDPTGNITLVITPRSILSENVFGMIGKEASNGTSTICVCGFTKGDLFQQNRGSGDAIVFALSGDTFNYLWALQINDTGDSQFLDMAWDIDDNYLFAVGKSNGTYPEYGYLGNNSGSYDILLAKIDSRNGSVVWVTLFGSSGSDYGISVSVDLFGFIYIAGSVGNSLPNLGFTSTGAPDGIVLRLLPSGDVQWVTPIATDQIEDMESVTAAGNFVVTAGYTYGNLSENGIPLPLNQTDYSYYGVLCCLNATNGSIEWCRLEVADQGTMEYIEVIYSEGTLYVGGNINGLEFRNRTRESYDFDIIFAIYNMTGEMTSFDFLGALGDEAPQDLYLASNGTLYIAGWTTSNLDGNNTGGQDFVTVKAVPAPLPPLESSSNFNSSSNNDNSNKDNNDTNNTILIAVLCSVILVGASIGMVTFLLFRRKKINQKRYTEQSAEEELKTIQSKKPENPKTESATTQTPAISTPNPKSELAEKEILEDDHAAWHDFWELDYSEIRLGKALGRGAFGIVYKAEWRNSECVVKQAQLGTSENKTSVIAFLKEAEAIRNLRNHRNVCSILGICTNPNYPICIVMQYCNGGNLENAIRSGKIPVNEKNLIRISKDVCSGMSHIHKENILHLDLACRNLLVDFEGSDSFVVKISDFGLSRITENGKVYASQETIFSFRWTPPEGFTHMKFTRATDIWAFGVVLWEILECQIPYGPMSTTQVMDFVVNQKKTLPPPTRVQYPPVFYEIMQMSWMYDPTQRPTFDELYQLFRHFENTGMSQESQEVQTSGQQPQAVYGRKSSMDIPIPNTTAYTNNSLDSYV